jgi:ATP-dependent DNA helicase DinG
VREWWQQTTSGDLTELADLESATFVPLITSTVDNCLGAVCPHVAACPLYLARARAQDADLLVINHHLLFADLALKEQGFASLLPDVATIVVDEAHQIIDVARHFLVSASAASRLWRCVVMFGLSYRYLLVMTRCWRMPMVTSQQA